MHGDSDWIKMDSYKCVRCNKVFQGGHPERCICRSPFELGQLIGVFKMDGPKDENERIPVICLLCDSSKSIHYTLLKRQKSCGCKPRWIIIKDNSEDQVRYFCKRCGKSHTETLPVLAYCCE